MKHVTPLLLILMLLASCEQKQTMRFGFDSSFDNTSNGITMMSVNKMADVIYLDGTIQIDLENVTVLLLTPNGETVFNETFHAPESFDISESYNAEPGIWTLKYISNEGQGTINLHMTFEY